jgi:hypothetical protein
MGEKFSNILTDIGKTCHANLNYYNKINKLYN